MIWTHVAVIGVLVSVGVYLLLHRELTRILLGFAVLAHGANLLLLVAGGQAGEPPFITEGFSVGELADPLPQALALTAIVITFGTTTLLLALAYRSWLVSGDDEVQDDLEDRRIAREGSDEDVS